MISKSEIGNALADCLTRIEAGSTIDQVLADYPHLAGQLRELLSAAQAARLTGKTVRVPASAQIDSRTRMLVQAQALKRRDKANVFLPLFRFLSHNSGTILVGVTAFALFLIALSSTRALPGDGLYPVKIVAEQAGSSIYVGSSSQMQREEGLDRRRTAEINQMILEQRTGSVQFGGFLEHSEVNGWQAAGISLGLPTAIVNQSQALLGAYVDVNGFLDGTGVVEVKMIHPRLITIRGTLLNIQGSRWQVDSSGVLVSEIANMNGDLRVGTRVVVQAARMRDTQDVLAISIKVDGPSSLKTTEPVEIPPPTTATRNSAPLPTRPATIQTPQPRDDSHPDDPQPTSEDDHEDDSHNNGEGDSHKDD